MNRWIRRGLIAIVALASLAVIAACVVMGPRNAWGMLRYDQREEGKLQVGDPAPDVALVALDGTTRVRLAEHLHARPAVLIFGSFT